VTPEHPEQLERPVEHPRWGESALGRAAEGLWDSVTRGGD